tara:strand:- start:277 stop:831 length:555 start_codon:yes stop_codon:yes gene_type:complete
MKKIIGILLAGGQSRRMGVDKAELVMGGMTQLQRTQQLLLDAGCNTVFISRNNPRDIADIYFNQGPLAGIHAVLSHLNTAHKCLALVMPVDMPLLHKEPLIELIGQANLSGRNSYFKDCYLPCALHINDHTAANLKQRLQQQLRSVKGFLADSNAVALQTEQQQLINTNTPNEWQQACSLHGTH